MDDKYAKIMIGIADGTVNPLDAAREIVLDIQGSGVDIRGKLATARGVFNSYQYFMDRGSDAFKRFQTIVDALDRELFGTRQPKRDNTIKIRVLR